MKSLYRAYNDSSFIHAVKFPQWQGMMGPILRAEVGDTLEIEVRNLASRNYSMHPHVSIFFTLKYFKRYVDVYEYRV
jgi:hypothetical protein